MRKLSTFVLILSLAAMLAACGESEPAPGAPALDAEAIAANNRGVGLMGRFEYAEARTVFAGLVEQWPDWHDARINLAIATLNRQEAGDETAALGLARQAMQEDPDNLRARYVAGLVQLYLGEPAEALFLVFGDETNGDETYGGGRFLYAGPPDAEGRMVLADTLALASRGKPHTLIDYATLTGSCINAITTRYCGVFTNRAEWHPRLKRTGQHCGERVWSRANQPSACNTSSVAIRSCASRVSRERRAQGPFPWRPSVPSRPRLPWQPVSPPGHDLSL